MNGMSKLDELKDELKKEMRERFGQWRSSAKARVQKFFSEGLSPAMLKNRFWNIKFIGGFIAACLVVGFLIGFSAMKGPAARLVHAQPDGSFVFSNFETPEDMNHWKVISAQIAPSINYAWEKSRSAQVTFEGGKEISAATIGDIGKNKTQPSDWSSYGALQFYVFHPQKEAEAFTFMVTDLWGKQYEETLSVPPGIWARFTVPVSKIANTINVKKVNQFSVSRREGTKPAFFYFDDFRLLPGGESAGAPARPFMDYGFAKRKPAWMVFDPQLNNKIVRVPFIVKNETDALCQLCPVEGGVPLPMGEVKDIKTIRIRNSSEEDLPFQVKALAYWPDQSVKWVGVHFATTLRPHDGAGFFLDYGPYVRSFDFANPLKVEENDASILVNTGVMETVLNKKSFYLFDRVSIDQNTNGLFEPSEEISSKATLVLTFRGKEFRTDLDRKTYTVEVEEKGSRRVVVKASGWYESQDGERYCQAIVRYYFYQGKSHVRLSHSLIYTGYPANKVYAAYQMLQLPENETIDAYGLRIPFRPSQTGEQVFFGRPGGKNPIGIVLGGDIKLFQKDYDHILLNRDAVDVPFDGTTNGWLDLSESTRGMAVAVRNFRENFPKAFKISRSRAELLVDLWPKEAGPIDLSTTSKSVGPDDYGRGNAFGLGKTHELLLYFHRGDAAEANVYEVAGSFMEPFLVRPNPYWVDATGTLGRLFPVDHKYATQERVLEGLFDWADRHPRHFKWYGMLDFGDTLTWWRDSDEDGHYGGFGWHPIGRWGWYNCEGVGTHTGALLQYVRSGAWKYFEFGENLTQHLMDVDTVHYNTIDNDKRIKHVLNHRYSRVGAMHRHSGDHWGGRTDEASHTSVVGILLYYYLTANERALDVAKEIGEYFLTEPFTYIDRPDVAPNRAMANALWGDVLLYQLTWDERYKKAAEKLVKIFLKGQQADGSFLENYNPLLGTWNGEKHELYMSGYLVGALIAYHELTQDQEVKEMFLRLVRYLAPTEFSGPVILHGIAYAYLITKDPYFITMAEENMKKIISNTQMYSQDPFMNGLVYEKPIYHRPMAFLSTVPYVFGAFEEYFREHHTE